MVSEYNDRVRGSKEEVAPLGNSTDNSEKFLVIDLIVTFCWTKGFREVEAGMIISVIVFLKENSSIRDKRSVSGNSELLLGVRIAKDRSGAEGFFDFVKGVFLRL